MRIALFLVAIALLLGGCSEGGGPGRNGPPPVPVTLLPLERELLFERISLLGESRSQSDAVIRAQTAGVVANLLVDVGDEVRAGEVVAYLDSLEQRIALAEAEARLAEARSRLDELLNGTRPEVLSQRESEHRASRAREREAEAQLAAIRALAPQLSRQVEGDYQAARAAEQNAADDLRRTEELVKQGALSARDLVRVRAARDQARGELIRAEQARAVQKTTNQRDEANAVAALEAARAERARTEAVLSESREGPRYEVIAAQREIVSALVAARERAALEYERTRVKAPTNGTVRARAAAIGDRLDVGDPLLELAGDSVEFYFEAPESVLGRVEKGQTVLLGAGSRSKPIEGKVAAVARAVDPQSRRQSLRVAAPTSSAMPGEAVRGTLLVPVKGNYLTTHRDALVDKSGRWVVYSVDSEKKAVEHTVDYLAAVDDTVAIANPDLVEGEQVVGRGSPGLYPGALVSLPQPAPTETPEASAQ